MLEWYWSQSVILKANLCISNIGKKIIQRLYYYWQDYGKLVQRDWGTKATFPTREKLMLL